MRIPIKGDPQNEALVPLAPGPVAEPRTIPAQVSEPIQGFVAVAAYWHILLKRRWTVLASVVILTTIVAIASFKMKPIYLATSRVQVEAETPLVQSVNDIYNGMQTDDSFLQTQIQVLRSENLAWETIEQLRLGENGNFTNVAKIATLKPEARKVALIGSFQDRLSVALIPRTRVLTVGFESPDPELSAQIANAVVKNYIDYNFKQKYEATRQASGWMEQQLDELKVKVEQSQQALVDYEREHALAEVGSKDKQSVEEQMLADLSKNLTTAQSDRIQKESLYNQVLANRAQVAVLAHNDLLQKLEEDGAHLKEQYLDANLQYGPKYPKVVRLKQQLDENQSQINEERNRAIDRIRNDYLTAVNREKLANTAVTRQKEQLGSANQLLVQHNILQREFDANQQLYQSLMQRLKDATVAAGLRSTNIHQVDLALAPASPIRPRRLLNITIGFLAGIILGVVLAFAQEGLDHSITGAEEAEALLGIPSLGVIPLERGNRRGAYGLRAAYGLKAAPSGVDPQRAGSVALATVQKPNSIFAEAYRSLRTAILLSLANRVPKSLLVTSAQSGEGKTTTCLNLATVMAQRDVPVLLIDADMRKPGVTKLMDLTDRKGLSTVLTGTHTLEEAVQTHPLIPNLRILPAGPIPPSAADLLSSEKMSELIRTCEAQFEHVIIDSPPVLAVTDATIISRMVDGVVLVVQSGGTSRGGLRRMARILETAGARILGVILNKFDARQQGYYDGYYRGYYSYHMYGRYGEPAPYGSTPPER